MLAVVLLTGGSASLTARVKNTLVSTGALVSSETRLPLGTSQAGLMASRAFTLAILVLADKASTSNSRSITAGMVTRLVLG